MTRAAFQIVVVVGKVPIQVIWLKSPHYGENRRPENAVGFRAILVQ